MRDEVLRALRIREDGIYLDCTFGRGGHARAILTELGPSGRLVVIDRDPQAVALATSLSAHDSRVTALHTPFSMLSSIITRVGLPGKFDGVLFDLGVSSPQLDTPQRGFSFRSRGPLDMRMDPSTGTPVSVWLASASEAEMVQVMRTYGEERFARGIARAIVAAREQAPITNTLQLADIVAEAVPSWAKVKKHNKPSVHPATRTFQAFRIFINRELDELVKALDQLLDILAPGGRVAVLSFHSLEDRIVKRYMRDHSRPKQLPKRLPVMADDSAVPMRIVEKPQRAQADELERNPRARSAVLRVAERVGSPVAENQ